MSGPETGGRMNAWLPLSPCTPGCLPAPELADPVARVLRAARAVARGTAVGLLLGCGALLALALPVLGPGAVAVIQRRWALALLAAAGVRLRVHGVPPPPGAGTLIVANHVSWLDALALHAVAPVRMLAKREVRAWPLVGAMAARGGTVFLDRDRLHELPRAVALLAGVLGRGGAVGVFPEGTTRCGRALGSFRPAAFQAAIDSGATVQPVALRYRDGGAAFVGDDTLLSSLRRVLSARRVELDLTVLRPLAAPAPAAGADRVVIRRDLARRCESVVARALGAGVPAVADLAVGPAPAAGEVLARVA